MYAVITTYSWEALSQVSLHNSLEKAVASMMDEYRAEVRNDSDNGYNYDAMAGYYEAQITNYRRSGDIDVTTWRIGVVD